MKDFKYWNKQHESSELKEFNSDKAGLLWLKVKSITRGKLLNDFATENKIVLKKKKLDEKFQELFTILNSNPANSLKIINAFVSKRNNEIVSSLNEKQLARELYKVDSFKWGADNQNDLSKYLVKRYVKDNRSYDVLISKIDTEITKTVQDYLVCSWYNHWTSILIEHIFKSHKIVQPTVGQIKSVDFFMNEIPFDLKATYLPANFIDKQRKQVGLLPELTFLKQSARKVGIKFKNNDSNLYYQLTEQLKDKNSIESKKYLAELKSFRIKLINKIKANPKTLAQNLYEEQSDFRFGAENRIFLIFIDTDDFGQSWKLRRNIDLLQPSVKKYLDGFSKKSTNDLKLTFYKKGNPTKFPKQYEVLTDVIFAIK